jgi:hypothetical protein
MSTDRQAFKNEVTSCLRTEQGVNALVDCIARHFPDLEVYRQNDDLIIKHARQFLIVRRVGVDQFLIAQHIAVPTTNEVDFGGGMKRDVDHLFDEIDALSKG